MSARDAVRVVEDAAAIKNMAATVEALAAGRVAETELWREEGERSPAHELARKTGTSVGDAKKAIETGRKLRELSATSDAARRGALSRQQADAIAAAASADPHAEQQLLDTAKSGSLGELRGECGRTKAKVCDLEERRRRIHDRRNLRTWTDADGAGHLHLLDNPEIVAELMARETPLRVQLAEQARATGQRRDPGAGPHPPTPRGSLRSPPGPAP